MSLFGGTATRSSVFGSLLITWVPGEGSGIDLCGARHVGWRETQRRPCCGADTSPKAAALAPARTRPGASGRGWRARSDGLARPAGPAVENRSTSRLVSLGGRGVGRPSPQRGRLPVPLDSGCAPRLLLLSRSRAGTLGSRALARAARFYGQIHATIKPASQVHGRSSGARPAFDRRPHVATRGRALPRACGVLCRYGGPGAVAGLRHLVRPRKLC